MKDTSRVTRRPPDLGVHNIHDCRWPRGFTSAWLIRGEASSCCIRGGGGGLKHLVCLVSCSDSNRETNKTNIYMLNRLSRRCFCSATPLPWLFVGLGNPGDKYQGTRHNVGFEMIDAFAESVGIPMNTVHCKAIFGKGFVGDVPVFLAKPQTYMNLSGESTGPLAAYYKLPLNHVLVFHDDMNLPCGVLRLHDKGGHGSHKGLKSVIYHLRGNREFPRLRIGIGKPPGQMDPKAFLLQKFNVTARHRIDEALEEGVDALKLLLSEGLDESAKRFNKEQKYKHLRVQTLTV